MSKTLKIYLLVFAVLIALMIAIDQSREKPLDWSPTYLLDDKKPLDLYVLNREIDHLINNTVVRYDRNPYEYFQKLDSLERREETYLFINQYSYIDKALGNKLLNAVDRGGTLFIVSDGFTPFLIDTLRAVCEYAPSDNPVGFHSQDDDASASDKLNTLNRSAVKLRFSREVWAGQEYSYSPLFGQYAFVDTDTTTSKALGYMTLPNGAEYINFMEFRFGKGKVILHNQPVVFSNYSLLSDDLLQEYAERTLSYLPDQPVVWFVSSQQHSEGVSKTPLSVIFRYPALRMVWLIFIYGIILFILFTAKRKQRVVPAIKPLKNTTVEFAQTIGNLYFQEGDISDIARKKIIYFLDRVRRTYNIDTQLPEDKLIQRLHLKSGKEKILIEEILALMRKINDQHICGKQELIQLNELMDRFWEGS